MTNIILAFFSSFSVTFLAIPNIIRIAKRKKYFDEPVGRSAHYASTPTIGGVAIALSCFFSFLLWTRSQVFSELQYLIFALLFVFLVGLKDDIDPIKPVYKLLAQIAGACILIFLANQKINLGSTLIPAHLHVFTTPILSLILIIIIINAYNFIDGIDGLSGSLGIIASISFGTVFCLIENYLFATFAFSLTGSLLAFLYFNISPSRIFLGDSGSLFTGTLISVFVITLLSEAGANYASFSNITPRPFALITSIVIIPSFDAVRVVIKRLIRGRSPFKPDKKHIHHLLVDLELSHMQATSLLVGLTITLMSLVLMLSNLSEMTLLLILFFIVLIITSTLNRMVNQKARKHEEKFEKL